MAAVFLPPTSFVLNHCICLSPYTMAYFVSQSTVYETQSALKSIVFFPFLLLLAQVRTLCGEGILSLLKKVSYKQKQKILL